MSSFDYPDISWNLILPRAEFQEILSVTYWLLHLSDGRSRGLIIQKIILSDREELVKRINAPYFLSSASQHIKESN